MINLNRFLILFILVPTLNVVGQNTPSLWKHTCNCGGMNMITIDDNGNSYVFNDGQNGAALPTVLKLSPTGSQKFNNNYLPSGYLSMEFNNVIYKNGRIYIAGNVSNSTDLNRLCLTTVDTLGNMINQLVVDSIQINPLSGIESAPFYSYGFKIDQFENLHVAFSKNDQSFNKYYCFLKFDLAYNLLASFTDSLGLNTIPGPCTYQNDGTVYYSYSGNIVKLNNSYSSIDWLAPLNNQFMDARKIRSTSNSNIYILTAQLSGVQDPTYTLVKIQDNGLSYANIYDSLIATSPGLEFTQMLVDDSSNSVYHAGYNTSSFPYRRYVVKQDGLTGSIEWRDSSFDGQFINALLLSAQNNLVAIGGGTDYYVWLYNSLGTVDAIIRYDGPCGANDNITAARFDPNEKLIVTGSSCENASSINWGTTLKYNIPTITTSIPESSGRDITIYPTPAVNEIKLNTQEQILDLTAFDILGNFTKISFTDEKNIDVSFLSAGVYLLQVNTATGLFYSKLLISK